MPFVPSYTTAHQRQAFANRLAFHLAPTSSRQSLMALQEAFSRAGGFSDAHAAQACLNKQRSFRQLMAPGKTPEDALAAFRFLGIGPAKLFQWAKESRKKYARVLNRHPFGLQDAEELLAALWQHADWASARTHASPSKSRRAEDLFPPYLMTAPTLEALRQQAWESSGRAGNRNPYPGLYCTWGLRTTDQHWVGQAWEWARSHALLVQDDPKLRYQAVFNQVEQRLSNQDSVIVLDASADQTLLSAITQKAGSQGQHVHVIDWTNGRLDPVGLLNFPTALQHHLFLNSLNPQDRERSISFWARKNLQAPIIAKEDTATLEQFMEFLSVFAPTKESNTNLFSKPIVFWKLPSTGKDAHARQNLAMGILKTHIEQKLGYVHAPDPQGENSGESNSLPTHQLKAIFTVDIPLSVNPRGMATVYAQGRAVGVILTSAQSALMIQESGNTAETQASIANINTKLVAGPRLVKDEIWARLGMNPQNLSRTEARIVCGGSEETLTVFHHRLGQLP